DSFISFRYVDRLLQGKGLTWTDGQPVEGYSNLLWVLLLAGLKKITQGDLWVIALLVNYLCSIVSCWLMLNIVAKLTQYNATAITWTCLLFVLSAPVAIWINGGLEAPLIMLLLILALSCLLPFSNSTSSPRGLSLPPGRLSAAGVFLGLVALTRPDGILFAAAITLAIAVYAFMQLPRENLSVSKRWLQIIRELFLPMLLLNAIVFAFYLGQLVFRLHYYGQWVPNTALVKIGFTITRISGGLVYAARMLAAFIPFIVLLVLLFRRSAPNRAKLAFFLVIIAVIALYLALIGGDIFPGYRHVLPLVPLLCIAGGIVMMDTRSLLIKNNTVYYCVALALLAFVFVLQFMDSHNRDGKKERWEWNGMAMGQTLEKGFKNEQPSIATTAAGVLPCYAGFPTLDMLGLNDYYLPRHPPPGFGKGYLGHELGDAAYYLKWSPDIFFLFGLGSPKPYFRAETEMFADTGFQNNYEKVKLAYHLDQPVPIPYWKAGFHHSVTLDDTCYMFVKKYSERIGIRFYAPGAIVIPAYFFRNRRQPDSSATTYLNNEGQLVVSIAPGEEYFIKPEQLKGLFLKKGILQCHHLFHHYDDWSPPLLIINDTSVELHNTTNHTIECNGLHLFLSRCDL
ncbi:MAG TPA: hypothetical protein VGM41_12620, partial [Chitinophagaceae bacterium]